MEKSIHLVSTVMHESLQNAINNFDENLLEEVDSMVDELKQLSAALDVRSVCTLTMICLAFFCFVQKGSLLKLTHY